MELNFIFDLNSTIEIGVQYFGTHHSRKWSSTFMTFSIAPSALAVTKIEKDRIDIVYGDKKLKKTLREREGWMENTHTHDNFPKCSPNIFFYCHIVAVSIIIWEIGLWTKRSSCFLRYPFNFANFSESSSVVGGHFGLNKVHYDNMSIVCNRKLQKALNWMIKCIKWCRTRSGAD